MNFNIGVDLGGTKILVEALTPKGEVLCSFSIATPRHDYGATIKAITALVHKIEVELNQSALVGIGLPGSLLKGSGLVQNANSTWLNGKDFATDMSDSLNRELRLANDANCFALSEAIDGAGFGAASVFGVILGTGVGGGLVLNGEIINGPRSIGGEWGHCALPFCTQDEVRLADLCWCGQRGCIESWLSGPALTKRFNAAAQLDVDRVEDISRLATSGNIHAIQSLKQHSERLARGLSMVVNIFDPRVIVLGGGLSCLDHLYDELPELMQPFIFSDDDTLIDIRRPKFGATSGVRGAARLWPFKK